MSTFTFYCDPGHAWLRVSLRDLEATGLKPGDFTQYSYISPSAIFLEEDCDATKFLAAYEAKHGKEPRVNEMVVNGYSTIRRLPPNVGA